MVANGSLAAVPPSQRLLRRLDDPQTADALERLLDRLDILAFAVEATEGFLRRGDEITENIGDALREAKAAAPSVDSLAFVGKLPQLANAGVKLADATASPAFDRLLDSGLLERLAAPDTLASLQTLLDKLPLVAFAVAAVEGFLQRGEEIADNVAGALREANHFTSPVDRAKLGQLVAGLPKLLDAGLALIDSGLLDPAVIATVAEVYKKASEAYVEAKRMPDNPIGPWGIYKALRDPDVQRAVGAGLHIVKRYGEISKPAGAKAPPAGVGTG